MIAEEVEKVQLKKKISLFSGVMLIIGSVIGSGIFISPAGVFIYSQSVGVSLIVWTLSGVFSTIGALCYAELGTCITRSGGDYAYILEIYGELMAFLKLWIALIIIRPVTQTVVALTFAEYAVKPFYPDCKPSKNVLRLLAATCLCALTAVNCLSVRWAVRIQTVFTGAKLLSLLAIVITGILHLSYGNTEYFENAFTYDYDYGNLALAFYSGLFSFGGWNSLNYVTEELKNPYKNLPRAIWIAMTIVTIIYVMVNVAYFAVVSPDQLVTSPAVAVSFGNRLFGKARWTVPVFVALSTFGGVNGILFTSARLFMIASQEGHLPISFSFIHIQRHTPVPPLMFTCLISLCMLFIADVFVLINYFSQALWASIFVCITGLLYLRVTKPDINRPLKINIFFPIVFLLCCFFLVAVSIYKEPWNTAIGSAIIVSGIPVYYVCIKWKIQPLSFQKLHERFTVVLQKTLNVVIPDNENEVAL